MQSSRHSLFLLSGNVKLLRRAELTFTVILYTKFHKFWKYQLHQLLLCCCDKWDPMTKVTYRRRSLSWLMVPEAWVQPGREALEQVGTAAEVRTWEVTSSKHEMGKLEVGESFLLLKPATRDKLPPTRPLRPNLLKQRLQLGPWIQISKSMGKLFLNPNATHFKEGLTHWEKQIFVTLLWDSNKGGLSKSMLTGSGTIIHCNRVSQSQRLVYIKKPHLNKKYFHINCIVKPASEN